MTLFNYVSKTIQIHISFTVNCDIAKLKDFFFFFSLALMINPSYREPSTSTGLFINLLRTKNSAWFLKLIRFIQSH